MKVRKHKTGVAQIRSEITIALIYIKTNLAAAAELRVSFVMQVIGMMLNNTTFVLIWVLFFQAFGSINGWDSLGVLALQGIVALIFGVTYSFFSGVSDLPQAINNGVFDSVLLTPRNIYVRVLTLTTRPSAVGDILYGVLCLVLYAILAHLSFLQIVLLIFVVIPASIILTNFALIAGCVGFLIPDADELIKNLVELLLGPSMYPSGIYQGWIRFFFLFIIPAISIAGLPVEAVKEVSIVSIVFVWVLALFWTGLAVVVLRFGMKHYESGNLTGARV